MLAVADIWGFLLTLPCQLLRPFVKTQNINTPAFLFYKQERFGLNKCILPSANCNIAYPYQEQ